MKKRTLALGAVVLVTGGCGHPAGHAGGAADYAPPGGGFAVTPPVTPTVSTSPINTAVGTVTQHTFTAETDNDDAYMVDYADYPESIRNASPYKVLEGACSGAAGSIGGTVQNERTILLDGNPGRDFTTTGAKGVIHAHVYMVGVRLYQVMTVHTNGASDDAEDAAFLNSFRLTR